MTIALIILLSISVFMILFGHFILSAIDKYRVYPKRLAKLQAPVPTLPPTNTAPADDLPPAILSMLWNVQSTRNSKKLWRSTRFTVTLLDLIHCGKIGVLRDGKKLYLIPKEVSDDDLRPYERTMLAFVRNACRSSDRLTVARLKGYIEEHREEAAAMRVCFMKELMSDFDSRGYYAVDKCKSNVHPLALIGGISILASLGALLGWLCHNIPLGVISICFTGFAVWLSFQVFTYDIPYLTDRGIDALSRWDAYNRFIHSLPTSSENAPSVEEWSRIALYGAAMEGKFTFQELTKIWKDLPKHSLECELYDPYFYKKISEIDYAILISNAESIDNDLFKQQH